MDNRYSLKVFLSFLFSFTTITVKINTSENSLASINIAGFVFNNNGSITHSRVGGTSKLKASLRDMDIEDIKGQIKIRKTNNP